MKQKVDILIQDAAELLTLNGSERARRGDELRKLHIIENGSVAIKDGKIIDTGEDLTDKYKPEISLDASNKIVMPGFVDSHTHLVFAGSRAEEIEMKIQNCPKEKINEKFGIYYTVEKTRKASEGELIQRATKTLDTMLLHGTTTIEAKSGYDLTYEGEIKILNVIRTLNQSHDIDIIPTFLGAHKIPKESNEEEYTQTILEKMLPDVKRKNLAEFCDVWPEKGEGYFSLRASQKILESAKTAGMKLKIHADEFSDMKAASLAAHVNAVSADHLLKASDQGLSQMAERNVIACLLPGTPFVMLSDENGKNRYARARWMIKNNVPVALATDYNALCPVKSMQTVMALAIFEMRMLPSECISASTINGAFAIARGEERGTLEKGRIADLIVCDIPTHKEMGLSLGTNIVETVIKNGEVVVEEGRLTRKR